MEKEIVELSKPSEGKNWKLEISVGFKPGRCESVFFYPSSSPLVFHCKAVEANFDDIWLNREISHCLECANDIISNKLEKPRNGIVVKNPEVLPKLKWLIEQFLATSTI